ncbi:MAG: glycine--tRNA ligase subunit beta [Armatimonadota bacterium]|nr:glycine--tRNA ligase subunit beta [Armatimonadota bacterium]MDR5697310.1 glycine--tRNA ligase subunit beta [Armatimonadota bacterium]
MPDLLFEIGTEEMPARFVSPASRQLQEAIADLLAAEQLPAASLRTWATPRRLAVLAAGIPARQAETEREVRGPAARAAYGEDGKPTRAAEGFARSVGVAVEMLERRRGEGGEYVFARVRIPGRPAAEVLADRLPAVVTRLAFPKTMRWGALDLRFGRPIRWIAVLLDDEVVPFEVAGVYSGRSTRGHRTLSPGPHVLERADAYEATLERHFVIGDADRRAERIRRQAVSLAAQVGGQAEVTASLLEEVTFLVEYPTAFLGRFDPSHLSLPPEILVTVMRHHQRYFPVRGSDGGLLAYFVAVRDGDEFAIDTVREGNEWVLGARLTDARFFYDEDRRQRLEDRLGRLAEVVFHRDLGSMLQKTERVVALAGWLADRVGLDTESRRHLLRAAHLCKADLGTHVVAEFPELQGIVGGIYARLDGEPEPVARAIAEHYRPRGADDKLPQDLLAALLGLADRADTLAGLLSAGHAPSGSADPHGLRRAASGLLDILERWRLRLSIYELLRRALSGYPEGERSAAAVEDFVRDRLVGWLRERGYPHDTVEAVLADGVAGNDDPVEVASRAAALERFRTSPAFPRAYEAFDRSSRILGPESPRPGGPLRAEHPAERALRETIQTVAPAVQALVAEGRHDEALAELARFCQPVAALFDAVLINDPDPEVRAARHALLAEVVRSFRLVADFGRLVVPGTGATREAGAAGGTQ